MISPDKKIMSRILDVFRKEDGFIIFNHTNPDGDAVGSQIALYLALKKAGKKAYMFSAEKVSPNYCFLPRVDEINTTLPEKGAFEIAIMLDSASPDRAFKGVAVDINKYKVIINIDHHVSNKEYGTLNWVVPGSSSTGELVYRLIKEAKWQPDSEIGTCLYTAILTDTGGFRHRSTTAEALKYASELVEAGAQPHAIARQVYASFPERRFRLLGKALGTLKTIMDGRAALMWVYTDFHSEFGTTVGDTDEFVEYPRAIKGVQVACLFKENVANRSARVNLRSNNPERNVNRIASRFGGGGHTAAAACDIEGTREEMERKILDAVGEELQVKDVS